MSGTLPAACKSGTGLLLDCQRWLHLLLLTGLQKEGCLHGSPCSATEDVEKKKLTPSQKRRNLLRREKFLKKKFEDHQWKREGEAFAREAEETKADENGRRISTTGTHCPLVGSDRGLPFVKCVSQSAATPVSFTLDEMEEKYEAEKKKNEAMEEVKIKHKQNMERMTKIVGDYKSEMDKARKELKDAKGKK